MRGRRMHPPREPREGRRVNPRLRAYGDKARLRGLEDQGLSSDSNEMCDARSQGNWREGSRQVDDLDTA